MKFIFFILLLNSTYSFAESVEIKVNTIIQRMTKLRNDLGINDIIMEIDAKIEDKYDEITIEKVSKNSVINDGINYNKPNPFSLSKSLSPELGTLNFELNESLKTSLEYEVTKMIQDQEHLIKTKKNARIKEKNLEKKLNLHLEKNIEKIYELKYLHALALIYLIDNAKAGRRLSLETINDLERLGRFISFKGNFNTTFCTIKNYKESKSRFYEEYRRSINSHIGLMAQTLSSAKDEIFQVDEDLIVRNERTEKECTFKSKIIESNPRNMDIYKYSMTNIDNVIEYLSNTLAVIILLGDYDHTHIFSFGSTYYNQNSGPHPFGDL